MKPVPHTFVVLAAGEAARFGGAPKHLLEVDRETLGARIDRQFPSPVWMTADTCPGSRSTCETFLRSRPHWGEESVTILYGDVYYTDPVAEALREFTWYLSFFSDRQDIFALRVPATFYEEVENAAAKAIDTGNNNGRLWEMYRQLHGMKVTDTVPPPDDRAIRLVSDRTQDFDEPGEYEEFLEGISKNQLFKDK